MEKGERKTIFLSPAGGGYGPRENPTPGLASADNEDMDLSKWPRWPTANDASYDLFSI